MKFSRIELTHTRITALAAGALLVVGAPLMTACSVGAGNASSGEVATTESDNTSEATQADGTDTFTIAEGWAKSASSGGMTGVFGTLTNSGEEDLVIASAESDVAGLIELHEVTADGIMQEIQEDVIIPASGTYELAPGANHIMLMELHDDLLAGDEVAFSLALVGAESGTESTVDFSVLVKDYSGANEDYGDLAHGEHSHDEHSHEDHSHEDHSHEDEGHDSH